MDNSRSRWSSPAREALTAAALLFVGALAAVSAPQRAWAQTDEDDAVAKATQLNKDAVAAYQGHKTDEAKRLLKQALDLCDASGLNQHPVKARTLIHFGIVLIGGSKQRELGIRQFKKALAIQPEIALTKSLVTPELQQAFDDAKGEGKGETKPAAKPAPESEPVDEATPAAPEDATPAASPATEPPASPTPSPASPPAPSPAAPEPKEPAVPSTGLDHEPVTRSRPGASIVITVNVDEGLTFDKLVLAYRPSGATDYLGREMKQVDPGIYSAEIPARATSGTLVAYYIEAQDKNGDPVAARGSAEKPLVVMLGEARVAKKPGKQSDDEGDDDDDDDDEDQNISRFFIGIEVGSGAGYAKGNGDNDHGKQYSSGGIALAQAGHVAPELGYWIRPDLMLSVQVRYQLVTGTTEFVDTAGHVHAGINYAFAAFAKATWALGHGRLRPLLSLALGAGQIRHVVKNPNLTDCGPADKHTACVDTIAGGPVLAGVGAGIMYSLTPRIALLLVANTQAGVPNFTVNLDGNIGAAYQF